MFNKIPQTMSKPLTPKQRVHKIMTDIGGGWYMVKSSKGLTLLKISKLSKDHKTSIMKFKKKIYEANKLWNDWKSQLHWNKLEWVDPKTLIKRDKPYSVSSKKFT